MKHIYASICLMTFIAPFIHAIKPKVDYQPVYIEVRGLERTDSCLRLSVSLKHYPGYWVNLPKDECFLVARNDTSLRFKVKGSENLDFDKRIWMKDSARHDGVILFEPLPPDVRIVDFVMDKDNLPTDKVLGIHIYEEQTEEFPDLISTESLFIGKSKEKWTGLDPDRYTDIPCYKAGSIARLTGKINNYIPEAGFSTLTVTTRNSITGKQEVNLGEINPDGSFAMDVKLDYPQFAYIDINRSYKSIFFIPGDTLDIVTTTLTDYTNPSTGYRKYFGFKGKPSEAVAINLLTDSLKTRYDISGLSKKYYVTKNDTTASDVYLRNKGVYEALDKTVRDFPSILGDIPVSTFVKDMAASKTIADIIEIEEVNELQFKYSHQKPPRPDTLLNLIFPEYETLDLPTLFEPRQSQLKTIYHNPLMICTGWVIPNRWHFCNLIYPSTLAADGSIGPEIIDKSKEITGATKLEDLVEFLNKPTFEKLNILDADNLKKTGVGNCFATQLSRVTAMMDAGILTPPADREELGEKRKLFGNLASLVEYPVLNNALLEAYGSLAEDMAIAEYPSKTFSEFKEVSIDKNADAFKELIKPYLGNLIFVDFWGLGCGPCRSGMIDNKPIIDRYADKPFKVLYVSENSNIQASNRWLDKEGINGEHIYVSNDDWNRLSNYFGFTGIPFGVLVGKNGELLKTHFYLNHPGSDKEIDRHLNETSE